MIIIIAVSLQINVAKQIIAAFKRLHHKSNDDETLNNFIAFYHHATEFNSSHSNKKQKEISTSFPPALTSLSSLDDI